jgi:hypothetical protein
MSDSSEAAGFSDIVRKIDLIITLLNESLTSARVGPPGNPGPHDPRGDLYIPIPGYILQQATHEQLHQITRIQFEHAIVVTSAARDSLLALQRVFGRE